MLHGIKLGRVEKMLLNNQFSLQRKKDHQCGEYSIYSLLSSVPVAFLKIFPYSNHGKTVVVIEDNKFTQEDILEKWLPVRAKLASFFSERMVVDVLYIDHSDDRIE